MTTRKKLMLLFLLTSFAFTACSKASAGVAPEKTAAQTAALQEAAPSSSQEAESTEALPTSSGPEESSRSNEQKSAGRTAVVYFSATGTTAEIARLIAEETGADLLEIVPETAYTSEDLNYHDDNCRANREMNDDTARPAISSDFSHLSEYSVIYVGHPHLVGNCPAHYSDIFRELRPLPGNRIHLLHLRRKRYRAECKGSAEPVSVYQYRQRQTLKRRFYCRCKVLDQQPGLNTSRRNQS